MSELDDILSQSRQAGRFVERRRFSLAKDKAVEKLRRYSLPDPNDYVLELVRAGTFAQARAMAFEADDDRLTIAWLGGTPLQSSDLIQLFDFLLLRRRGGQHRQVVHVAMAVNAALQAGHSQVRIVSGDGTRAQTVRVDISASGEAVMGEPEEGLNGTFISVEKKDKPLLDHLISLQRDRHPSGLSEFRRIEDRCRWSTIPILLNGSAPFGLVGGRPFMTGKNFDDGQRWGSLEPAGSSWDPEFKLIIGGVIVQSRALPQLGWTPDVDGKPKALLRGIIRDDNLRRTADGSRVVEDAAFHRMLHAIQPHATALLKEADAAYVPPELEPVPEDTEPDDAQPTIQTPSEEPLPEVIPQLNRPDVSQEMLLSGHAGRVVCWARPEALDRISAATSPDQFPYPVLILRDGQHRTLVKSETPPALFELTQSGDVHFYLQAWNNQAPKPSITVPFDIPLLKGELTLTAHLAGPKIGWDLESPTGSVPVVITHKGELKAATSVTGLAIPRMLIHLRVKNLTKTNQDLVAAQETFEEIGQEARKALPKFLAMLTSAQSTAAWEQARREIMLGGLPQISQPHFHTDQGQTVLTAMFPRMAYEHADALRSTPLADTIDGTVSLDTFLALQGTEQTLQMRTREDLLSMTGLEQRFGYGNLCHDAIDQRFITAVATRRAGTQPQWHLTESAHLPQGAIAAVWVSGSLQTPAGLAGLEPCDTGLLGVGGAIAAQEAASLSLEHGLTLLFDQLAAWAPLQPGQSRPDGSPPLSAREKAMVDIAIASMIPLRPEWRSLPLFRVGAEQWSLGRLLDQDHISVVPRGLGPSKVDHAIALSFDEVRVIERMQGAPVSLQIDDTPTVWTSWGYDDFLIRIDIDFGNISGWIGLRYPHDASGAVMEEINGHLSPLAGGKRFPCHGTLYNLGALDRQQSIPTTMVALAQRQLYEALADQLAQDALDPDHRSAAEQYAQAWVLSQQDAGSGSRRTLCRRLAKQVTVRDDDGSEWGTLDRWLQSSEDLRPTIDHVPVETLDMNVGLPSTELPLSDWVTQVVQAVTQEPNLKVTVVRALAAAVTGGFTSDLETGFTIDQSTMRDWRTRQMGLSHSGWEWCHDPEVSQEARWMLTLCLLREWLPVLQKNWVQLDSQTLHQEMLTRLLVAAQP